MPNVSADSVSGERYLPDVAEATAPAMRSVCCGTSDYLVYVSTTRAPRSATNCRSQTAIWFQLALLWSTNSSFPASIGRKYVTADRL